VAIITDFPVGTRVRGNDNARSNHGYNRADRMTNGVVIEPDGSIPIHVDWGEGFSGHRPEVSNTLHNGHCYYMSASELEIISEPVITETVIPAIIPRLRVTIARNTDYYNQWQLTIVNGPTPTKYEMREYMDKGISRRLGAVVWRQDINSIIHRGIDTYGIDPEVFIAAITQASLAKQAREATGTFSRQVVDSELQMAMGSQPALIAIGDQLFSLQPKGVIKAGRAMAVIKDRIVKAARSQAEKVKAAAIIEAATIIRNGEQQLAEARRQIEIERAAITDIMTIPGWAAAGYLKVRKWYSSTYHMAIGIEVNTNINSWQMTYDKVTFAADDTRKKNPIHNIETIRWNNTGDKEVFPILDHYHTITIWMPFDPITGGYAYKSSKVIEGENGYNLPHINEIRCCMELQGLPSKMTTMAEYKQIAAAINRGNSEVNMMSLLCGYNHWHPDIQSQCPKMLKRMIDKSIYQSASNLDDSYFIDAVRIPVEMEAKETFNVDSLRDSRTARGESLPEISLDVEDGLAEIDTEVAEDNEHNNEAQPL